VTATRGVKPEKNQLDLPPEPLRGEARGVQIRSAPRQNGSIDILAFRVERFDQQEDRLAPIPAEMEGRIRGVLNEGDRVEINADWRPGQTLAPKRFRNVTTGDEVAIPPAGVGTIVAYALLALVVIFIIVEIAVHNT
jgi:hypothetical protein